jgi:hypothetical protein
MLKIENIELNENEEIILRYLYMQDSHKSNKQIAKNTDLEDYQVQYAMKSLDCEQINIFDVDTDENTGDIPDTILYMLNDRGRRIVNKRDLEVSKSTENSQKIKDNKEGVESNRDYILQLENRVQELESKLNNQNSNEKEQHVENLEARVEELQNDVSYIKDWIGTAEDYMYSFRVYYNNREDKKFPEFLDEVKDKIN